MPDKSKLESFVNRVLIFVDLLYCICYYYTLLIYSDGNFVFRFMLSFTDGWLGNDAYNSIYGTTISYEVN